jgi:hypothetical protein
MLKREENQLRKLTDPLHAALRSIVAHLEQRQAQQETSNSDHERSTDDAANRTIAAITELQAVIAANHREQAEQQNRGPGPWANFVVQCVLCVFTGLAFAAAAYYAYVTKAQLKEIQDQTPAIKAAANAANESLKQTTRSFQIDQRPYLIVSFPTFNPEILVNGRLPINSPITANITFVNIGKSPARKIVNHLRMVRYAPPQHREQPRNREELRTFLRGVFQEFRKKDSAARTEMKTVPEAEHDLAPQKDFFSTNDPDVTLSGADVESVMAMPPNAGRLMLFYVGVVTYTDLFESEGSETHETEFCYFFLGNNPNTWHICDAYNTIK